METIRQGHPRTMKYTCVPKYITVSGYEKECPETNRVNTQSIIRFFKSNILEIKIYKSYTENGLTLYFY